MSRGTRETIIQYFFIAVANIISSPFLFGTSPVWPALSTYLHSAIITERGRRFHYRFSSGSQCWSRDLPPALKCIPPLVSIVRSRQPMPARSEVLGDWSVGGDETLSVAR